MSSKKQYTSPFQLYGIPAAVLSIGGAIVLYFGLSLNLLLSWLISINIVAFCFYGFDKMKAQGGGLRIPENVLHTLVLVGGWVGGFIGMKVFHHKTSKGSFMRVFWAIVIIELIAICAYFLLI